MIANFTVTYRYGWSRSITAKVYAIDTERDKFLIADDYGCFKWVDMDECVLYEEEE